VPDVVLSAIMITNLTTLLLLTTATTSYLALPLTFPPLTALNSTVSSYGTIFLKLPATIIWGGDIIIACQF
jgi:hypothetical protein